MASSISASVGRKGKNKPEDVKTVQQLLNGFASNLKFAKLKVDMEDVSHEKFVEYFKGDGKSGTYICWWPSHCFVVINGNS